MKIFKKIAITLLFIIGILIIAGLFLPSKLTVEKEAKINAPLFVVFAEINSFKNFNKFSPWYLKDTAALYTYSGSESGAGAKIAWNSKVDDIGVGSMEITAFKLNQEVSIDLILMEGAEPTKIKWTLSGDDNYTLAKWGVSMDFGYNIPFRYMAIFFKQYLEKDFSDGISMLKKYVESQNAK